MSDRAHPPRAAAGARRVRALVEGRVQGVSFRWSAQEAAGRVGVTGWVRNLPDGRVEALIEGPAEAVERMIEWLRVGPKGARVTAVHLSEEPYRGECTDFTVRYR